MLVKKWLRKYYRKKNLLKNRKFKDRLVVVINESHLLLQKQARAPDQQHQN